MFDEAWAGIATIIGVLAGVLLRHFFPDGKVARSKRRPPRKRGRPAKPRKRKPRRRRKP